MGFFKDLGKAALNPFGAVYGMASDALGGNESDRDQYNQQMQAQLAQMRGQMPNLSQIYGQGKQNVLGSYKPFQGLEQTSLNQYYDQAKQNLNYNMNTQVGDASAQAGALAASRGFANPSGFVGNQAQNVRSSFVPQFGQLEGQRFNAMNDMQRYNNAGMNQSNRDYTQMLASLLSGEIGANQGDWANQMGFFNAMNGMAQNYDPYSANDKMYSAVGDFSSLIGLG